MTLEQHTQAYRRVLALKGSPGVAIRERAEALEVTISREEIRVRILVPDTVLEWFVEVQDRHSGSQAEDWCDYDGYDGTAASELDECMANEVLQFIANIAKRELRYVAKAGRGTGHLEWLIDGQWQRAVPFGPSAVC